MNDNKTFAAWALLVIGGASLWLLCLVLAGVAKLPPLPTIAEHVALGLGVRAAYKWVGGFDWADWSLRGDSLAEVIAVGELGPQPFATAEEGAELRRAA